MEQTIIGELSGLIREHGGLRPAATDIEMYLDSLEDIPDKVIFFLKDVAQLEAKEALLKNNGGIVAMATGSGKSKVGVDLICDLARDEWDAFLAVPTEVLRDVNWKEEFEKWGKSLQWEGVQRECYASLSKVQDGNYGIVVLDEAHNLTENSAEFFNNNVCDMIVALTATMPKEQEKLEVFKNLGLKVVYELDLDTAVKLKLVSPYEIIIVETSLEDKKKNVKGGTKKAPFMTTEKAQYEYLNKQVNKYLYMSGVKGEQLKKFAIMNRLRFVYNLESKKEAAQFILDNYIQEEERTLVFCGTIEQAEALAESYASLGKQDVSEDEDYIASHTFHSKTSDKWLNAFKEERINRLTCVKALNEGHNIKNVDGAIAVQVDSNDRNLVQRIGRTIRYRKGHTSKIWIICATGTQDEKWVRLAIEKLDKRNIKYVRFINLKEGHQVL